MSNEPNNDESQLPDEWEMYRQVFLDESDEDLESLVQALLRLEQSPGDEESLNEAFRLLHTHKGSAGLMGFDGISDLAHELENRFDEVRSGKNTLNQQKITAILKCVDFLKSFNEGLRKGETPDQDATALLRRLEEVEQSSSDREQPAVSGETRVAGLKRPTPQSSLGSASLHGGYRVKVTFEQGLQLADMKARLIVGRLSNIGEIIATEPAIDDIQSVEDLSEFALIVLTDHPPDEVRQIANVDGVDSVELQIGSGHSHPKSEPSQKAVEEPHELAAKAEIEAPSNNADEIKFSEPSSESKTTPADSAPSTSTVPPSDESSEPRSDRTLVSETVRVNIERLDKLMNLTGELVLTRARLSQMADNATQSFRESESLGDEGYVVDRFRNALDKLKEFHAQEQGDEGRLAKVMRELEEGLVAIEQQAVAWEQGRSKFSQLVDSVDQLSQISGNLQQSVLETRMVPVAPLFNRFRRVIRDLAAEREKKVKLVIRGDKTELDKRMIDELGDPLLHLVRNALDHGLESPHARSQSGKPEEGTITFEASHRGNNVFITITDDGAGINVDRIRARAVDRGLITEASLREMSDEQAVEFIWHPGFSTAESISDISGRGVGLDVVKSRISELNGSIELNSTPEKGTQFQLRLPLTLAIIRSLIARFRSTHFSFPLDDVAEIVAIPNSEIHAVHGGELIDIRGTLIPMIRMDRVFYWQPPSADSDASNDTGQDSSNLEADVTTVVVMGIGSKTIGVCVDELCGSQDVVIKSLADNFVNIRGLSGASIMGDGAICLMLDTRELLRMATSVERAAPTLHS